MIRGKNWIAKHFGTSTLTILRWVNSGMPCSRELSGQHVYLFDAEECRAWLLENTNFFAGKRTRFAKPRESDDPLEAGTIYGICDPRDQKIRYIGKAINLTRRIDRYRCEKGHSPHLRNWLSRLSREGVEPQFKVMEEALFDLSGRERWWISEGLRQGWKLMNQTDGGDGGQLSPEARLAAARKCRRSWWAKDEYRAVQCVRQLREIREKQRIAAARAARGYRLTRDQLVPLTHRGAAFIHLGHGKQAMVDSEDYPRVMAHSWHANFKCGGFTEYWRAKTNLGSGRCQLLNRFVVGVTDPAVSVRFKNGNQLDCRKSNLVTA